MITDFDDLMTQTVTIAPTTGRNAEGLPTHGDAVSYRARVVRAAVRTVGRESGQDEIATTKVWLMGVVTPEIDWKFTLPGGETPKLVNWETFPDEDGDHHTVLYFGGTGSSRG
jgi:hypothetical protein